MRGDLHHRLAAPAAALLVSLALAAAAAADQAKPADPGARDPNAPARVFTNKDLAKYRSSRPAPLVVDTTPPARAEGPAEETTALYPDEKERLLADVEQKISAAQARIAEIDLRLRSLANPFLPRPAVSEEQREAEAGVSAKEIFATLKSEKGDLERQVASLRSEQERLILAPTRPRALAAPAGGGTPAPPRP